MTGYELIDDNTLPTWLLAKHKTDGVRREMIRDEATGELVPEGKVLKDWKAGDAMYDPDGKPYLSLKVMISLCMGAIRQLDDKIEG